METVDEDDGGDGAGDEGEDRVHQVGACADGDEAGQRAVVHEAGVVPAGDEGRQHPAHHGHQRVDGDDAGDLLQVAGAHHVEAEPADGEDPGAQGQERDVADGDRVRPPLEVAPHARAEDEDRREREPSPDRVHHHGPCVVVELGAADLLEETLEAGAALPPDEGLEDRVGDPGEDGACGYLRPELRSLGDAA